MDGLGINVVLLTAQIISFGVLVFVMNKFLYKKLQKSLENRHKMIQDTIKRNDQSQKELASIQVEREKLHSKNLAESRALLAQAKKEANDQKTELLSLAEEKSKKLLEDAKALIDQERQNAQEELKKHAVALAAQMTQKVLSSKTNDTKWQTDLVEQSIKELKSHDNKS